MPAVGRPRRRAGGAGARRPVVPPWPPERFDASGLRRAGTGGPGAGHPLCEVPGLVDFVFLADPPIDEASWEKAVAGDAGAPRSSRPDVAAYERVPLGGRCAARGDVGGGRGGRAQARRRPRRRSGWRSSDDRVGLPLLESLRVLGRDEVLRRLDDRPRGGSRSPPDAALAVPPGLQGGPDPAGGDLRLLRRHLGAGVADLAPVRSARRRRHRGHGGGPVRRGAVARPAQPPQRGARSSTRTGTPTPWWSPGTSSPATSSPRPSRGPGTCSWRGPGLGILRPAAPTASRTWRGPPPSWSRAACSASSSPPTRSTRTVPWPSPVGLGPRAVAHPDPDLAHPGWSAVPYYLKEALAVGVGRVIGYGHLSGLVR